MNIRSSLMIILYTVSFVNSFPNIYSIKIVNLIKHCIYSPETLIIITMQHIGYIYPIICHPLCKDINSILSIYFYSYINIYIISNYRLNIILNCTTNYISIISCQPILATILPVSYSKLPHRLFCVQPPCRL